MVNNGELSLDADHAHTVHDGEEGDFDSGDLSKIEIYNWTGWIARHWPADVLRPGLMIYKFDKRRGKRRLCALVEISRGGAFDFSSMDEFVKQVKQLTGRPPDPSAGDDDLKKWQEIEKRLAKADRCTGICFLGNVVRRESIRLSGALPRIGWIDLTNPNYGMQSKHAGAAAK